VILTFVSALKRNAKRADRALNSHVPRINDELDESRDELTDLAKTLPAIRTEVSAIRLVYDSGRKKVNF
jgi:predicted  nucleic acid-binding Zn-ribbon protein